MVQLFPIFPCIQLFKWSLLFGWIVGLCARPSLLKYHSDSILPINANKAAFIIMITVIFVFIWNRTEFEWIHFALSNMYELGESGAVCWVDVERIKNYSSRCFHSAKFCVRTFGCCFCAHTHTQDIMEDVSKCRMQIKPTDKSLLYS